LRKDAISAHLGKHAIALAQIAKCRFGDIHWALMVFLQPYDLARFMQGQGIEQDGVHNTEYRCIRPDSKRYCHHCHNREAGGLPQHAEFVAQVL